MHFELYDPEIDVNLPVRATKFSAGYDFFAPQDVVIPAHGSAKVPTNVTIKPNLTDSYNWLLQVYPRSSLGIKKRIMLANTVGIVDADYCGFEIFIFLENRGDEDVHIAAGERFCQGVFVPYLVTSNDAAFGERVGGFGSTGK